MLLKISPVWIYCFFILVLAGCTKTPLPPSNNTPVAPKDGYTKLEIMPESTGEKTRLHIYNQGGVEIETVINYAGDRLVGHLWKNSNGKTNRRQYSNKENGQILSDETLAEDELTVISAEEYRQDGTLKRTVTSLPGGRIETTVYWYDGKRPFAKCLRQKDGSFTLSYYRKAGSLAGKKVGHGLVNYPTTPPDLYQYYYTEFDLNHTVITDKELYSSDGKLTKTVKLNSNGIQEKCFYNPPGTKDYCQVYQIMTSPDYGSQYYKLLYVDEFTLDGTSIYRRIVLGEPFVHPKEIQYFGADGTVLIRYLDKGSGVVLSEKIFDKSGAEIESKTYKQPEEEWRDNYRSVLKWTYEPYRADCFQQWNLQEYGSEYNRKTDLQTTTQPYSY